VQLFGNIRILAAHDARTRLQDRHAAAKATKRLRHLNGDVPASQHNEVRRHVIELQRLDVRQRQRFLQTGNVGNGCMSADIDDDTICLYQAGAPVIELNTHSGGRNKPAACP